jgi:large subunit ribosomal protein L25
VKDLTLPVAKRDKLGKKTRFLRRNGITPTHLFGHNIESLALQCDTTELGHIIAEAGMSRLIKLQIEAEKQSRSVFIRKIQRDELDGQLLHVDFYQVKKEEKITADIPIVLVGEAPALKEKGRILTQPITHLGVECLPDKLPPQIEIDLSPLKEVNNTIHVSDIVLDPGVIITTNHDQLVIKVSKVQVEKIEVVAEEVEAAAAGVEAGVTTEVKTPTGEESK